MKLQLHTKTNQTRLEKWLARQWAAGWTNIYDAVKLGLAMKSHVAGDRYDSQVDEIFLLSDGVPNRGEIVDPEQVVRHITQLNRFRKVRINTVFLASPEESAKWRQIGAKLMRDLASKNGGSFVQR